MFKNEGKSKNEDKFTIVTMLIDIGRQKWTHFRRSNDEYESYFRNLLSLKHDMIIFCESKFLHNIHSTRSNMKEKTTIILIKLEELYMYKYLDLLNKTIKTVGYGSKHPNPVCPEVCNPLYSLVTCSKVDILKRSLRYTDDNHLIWLDAGIIRQQFDSSKFNPTKALKVKDKVTMTGLRSMTEMTPGTPEDFFNQYIDIIAGGMISIPRLLIKNFHKSYYKTVDNAIKNYPILLDDQDVHTLLAREQPEYYNFIRGGWFSSLFNWER